MPSKPAKTIKISKSTKSATSRKQTAVTRKKVSSKALPQLIVQPNRYVFLAVATLISSALIAIAMGLHSQDTIPRTITAADRQGVMYIGSEELLAKPGGKLTVKLYASSGVELVNAVQGSISYPADKLKFAAFKSGTDYPKEAATDTETPGLIRIARSVNVSGKSLQGLRTVATIEFDVLPAARGTATFSLNKTASMIVRSSDNKNILTETLTTPYQIK